MAVSFKVLNNMGSVIGLIVHQSNRSDIVDAGHGRWLLVVGDSKVQFHHLLRGAKDSARALFPGCRFSSEVLS